jgi:hypothetical protein
MASSPGGNRGELQTDWEDRELVEIIELNVLKVRVDGVRSAWVIDVLCTVLTIW